ncbi:hypothetical protein [Streptomyces roseicoloratus]|uniref:hypothetical protein n=1 Tax=Streptomyces roseicoloratus TaxID=2508722 RepID=UPI001009877F|nr:hypothetical protein [Streptomyces roseicoloratus]
MADFSRLIRGWFREAAKWWLSVQLATERYVWSSVKSRLDHLKGFQWYIGEAGCSGTRTAQGENLELRRRLARDETDER